MIDNDKMKVRKFDLAGTAGPIHAKKKGSYARSANVVTCDLSSRMIPSQNREWNLRP